MSDRTTLGLPALGITVESHDGEHEVRLSGELDLATGASLREVLARFRGTAIVVDVSDLSFVDGAGLSALAIARRRAQRGGLTVRGARGLVRRVLESSGFRELLEEVAA